MYECVYMNELMEIEEVKSTNRYIEYDFRRITDKNE